METITTLTPKLKTMKRINKTIGSIVIILCVSVFIFPYFTQVEFLFSKYVLGKTTEVPSVAMVENNISVDELIIPKINVKQSIIEAKDIKEVHELVWRRPHTSSPDLGGNTVMVAHRYATIGGNRASTFYNLPDLVPGDMVYVTWKGKLYSYRVREIKVVTPTDVYIEEPTNESILTLYTCTPLWTATHRYVVIADLIP